MVSIQFIQPTEINQLVKLCELHAIFEQSSYDSENKLDLLNQSIFKENPDFYCLVAKKDHLIVGYATYMKQYATWDASHYIYMDCLFIMDEARSLGIGEQLINRIKTEGYKLGCSTIQWQTPDFNTRAIKFYKRIGATTKSKERCFLEI